MARCIAKKDYDKYVIPVAVRNLIRPNMKRQIFRELEKRHPCFSDEFSFDYSVRLCKSKFYLDVFVINKFKLMEYRKKTIFPHLGFRMESENKNRKFKNDYYKFFTAILIALMVILSLCWEIDRIKNHREIKISDSIEVNYEDLKTPVQNEKVDFNGVLQEILNVVQEEDGKLLYFAWNRDGLQENIKMKLKGVYPESLEKFGENKPVLVEYNGKLPEYDFVLNRRSNISEAGRDDKKFRKFEQKDIRDYIWNSNSVVNKEKTSPVEFDFNCLNLTVLGRIDDYLRDTGHCVKNLQIKSLENNGYNIVISFSNQLNGEYGILILLRDYENLFNQKQKQIIVKSVEKKEEKRNLKLIGKISYDDGKKLCFYKDSNGKMIKQMESIE